MLSFAWAIPSSRTGKNSSPSWRISTRLPARIGEPVKPAIEGRVCSKSARSGTRTCDSRSRRIDQRSSARPRRAKM
jgi:hypothetical protein